MPVTRTVDERARSREDEQDPEGDPGGGGEHEDYFFTKSNGRGDVGDAHLVAVDDEGDIEVLVRVGPEPELHGGSKRVGARDVDPDPVRLLDGIVCRRWGSGRGHHFAARVEVPVDVVVVADPGADDPVRERPDLGLLLALAADEGEGAERDRAVRFNW